MNHARLGQSLLLLEEFEEAVREYSQAHELDKNNQEVVATSSCHAKRLYRFIKDYNVLKLLSNKARRKITIKY